MAYLLKDELPRYGCDTAPQEFKEIVRELKAVMFPSWTDEELLYHPRNALDLVNAVRSRVRCGGLPDFLVLRALGNSRKASGSKR